jgi:hypothetical protein
VLDIPPDFVGSGIEDFLETISIRYEDEDHSPFPDYEGRDYSKSNRWESSSSNAKKSTPLKKKPNGLAGIVKTADAISEAPDLTSGLTPAALTDLSPGVAVVHPSFGKGTVDAIDGSSASDPKKVKVAVQFENFPTPKKLVFKYAKLALQ